MLFNLLVNIITSVKILLIVRKQFKSELNSQLDIFVNYRNNYYFHNDY